MTRDQHRAALAAKRGDHFTESTSMDPLNCTDACGQSADDEEAATQAGWSYLSITGRWRCPECTASLRLAAGIHGTHEQGFVDALPPNSIGALRKATAESILPVAVKP